MLIDYVLLSKLWTTSRGLFLSLSSAHNQETNISWALDENLREQKPYPFMTKSNTFATI